MVLTGRKKLGRDFYSGNVLDVARALPGTIMVRKQEGKTLAGRIVECEAYDGSMDEAAHTFGGKTERNKIMFGKAGYLYVYFTYGMHHCCNVVTGSEGEGQAVLIRALEPLTGIEEMAINRFGKTELTTKEKKLLTNGPAKLCYSLAIDKKENGTDLTGEEIYLLEGDPEKNERITVSQRIGIKKSVELPWRFFIKNNPYVSR